MQREAALYKSEIMSIAMPFYQNAKNAVLYEKRACNILYLNFSEFRIVNINKYERLET